MNCFRKKTRRESKKSARRHYEDNTLSNIISLRVSDEEMASLAMISRETSRNISDIMREALRGWQTSQRGLCLDS